MKNIDQVISELFSDPERFENLTRESELLDFFFDEADSLKLNQLLICDNLVVSRIGAWVASELGSKASSSLEAVCELYDKTKCVHTKYYCLEVIGVCSMLQYNSQNFLRVYKALLDENSLFKVLASRLIRNTGYSELTRSVESIPLRDFDKSFLLGFMGNRKNRKIDFNEIIEIFDFDEVFGFMVALASKNIDVFYNELVEISKFSNANWVHEVADEALELASV